MDISGNLENLIEMRLGLERLQQQLLRLESNAVSEKGTLQRTREELRHEISLLEDKFNDILFKPETGILIQIDRLIQDNNRRKKYHQQVIAQSIAITGILIKLLIDWLTHK